MEALPSMDLVAFAEPYLLIFARISAALTIAPGFSDTHLPVRYRLLFALALSFALKDILPIPTKGFDGLHLVLLLIQETIIGTLIGFIARLLISILDIIGTVLSLQIGLGNAMVFNPSMASQTSVVDHFVITAGIMLFFAMDLHHVVLKSLILSYNDFPLLGAHGGQDLPSLFSGMLRPLQELPTFFAQSFKIACQLSLPFLILGLLFQFILGLLNRVVPSIQVFFISLPLQIILGFALMTIVLGFVLHLALTQFADFYSHFLPSTR